MAPNTSDLRNARISGPQPHEWAFSFESTGVAATADAVLRYRSTQDRPTFWTAYAESPSCNPLPRSVSAHPLAFVFSEAHDRAIAFLRVRSTPLERGPAH